MLELKHVSYSYKVTKKRSSPDVNISSQIGHLRISVSLGNRPPLPLGWSGSIPEGAVLFDGRTSRPKVYYHQHHVSLVWLQSDWLIATSKYRLVQQTSWEEILLEVGMDETQNPNAMSAAIRRAAAAGSHCACARSSTLSSWMSRLKPWWTDGWHRYHLKETL